MVERDSIKDMFTAGRALDVHQISAIYDRLKLSRSVIYLHDFIRIEDIGEYTMIYPFQIIEVSDWQKMGMGSHASDYGEIWSPYMKEA